MGAEEQLSHRNRLRTIGAASKDGVYARLLQSLNSEKRVQGFTHGFYRYPARFSPEFVRYAIASFSRPGDTILDPFMGGGTTVVEALTLGRKVVGIDLNPLAVFVARVKSTPLSRSELESVRRKVMQVQEYPPRLRSKRLAVELKCLFRNVPWWIRNSILTILDEIGEIGNPRARAFLRCGLLKTAQWALDCKEIIPASQQFFEAFSTNMLLMCDQMEEYRTAVHFAGIPASQHVSRYRRLLPRSAADIDRDGRIPLDWLPFKLVVTSPPFPGVHVLYHRWQVQGRRETPAPFAILNEPDGHFPSFYTFAGRGRVEPYFDTLGAAYRSIASLLAPNSLVIQLVSFANPRRDVDRFLKTMDFAGFDECCLKDVGLGGAERLSRLVPNRKWYHRYRSGLQPGKELLLFHRPKRGQSIR